jgi:hypothetical protein
MEIETRIKSLGTVFRSRLREDLLTGALGYVDFNECALAIEMLCDHLLEHDIGISESEYSELFELAQLTGADAERVTDLQGSVQ